MAEIPHDIRREIFLRLPAKSLIRFRSVCKSWRHVIDDPSFVKAHTNNHLSSTTVLIRNSTGPPYYPLYSLDLEILNFADGIQKITVTPLNFTRSGLSRLSRLPVAACNGLMLITPDYVNKTWEIWNPFTHERLELPQRDFYSNHVISGLGYDHATDDYKVVVIDHLGGFHHGDKHVYETHVYSLKLDTWRKIVNCPCNDWWHTYGAGVFLSGALHWVSRDMIFVLDLTTEKYSKMELPPLLVRTELVIRTNLLDVLGGCLFLSDYGNDDYMFPHFDVWVMKDYGAQDSWIKLFSVEECSIRELDCLRPVAYMKNKMQVVLQDHNEQFYLFDGERNSVKMVSIHGLTGSLTAQSFHGSIFRLHDNCGVSKSVATTRKRKRKGSKLKMKMADSRLMFCLRESYSLYESHDTCYRMDSNCYSSSSEDED